jgi:hypothetical protein
MKVRVEAWHLPPRLLTGLYFLNSGLSKARADEATAAQLHGFATGTYPFLRKLDARRFTRLLSAAETAIGVALVLPVVPPACGRCTDRLRAGHARAVPADTRSSAGRLSSSYRAGNRHLEGHLDGWHRSGPSDRRDRWAQQQPDLIEPHQSLVANGPCAHIGPVLGEWSVDDDQR